MTTLAATSPTRDAYTAFAPAPPIVQAPARRHLPWGRIATGTIAAVVIGLGIGAYAYHAAGFESTDDAFLEGNVHPVSARLNGTVARVLVDDNAHVTEGQPLVELDPADQDLATQAAAADLAQARASATQVTAQVARARADVEAAAARITQNTAQLTRVETDFHRMEALASDSVRAISRQEFDASRATFETAAATQQSLKAERASAEASVAAADAQRAVVEAQIEKAKAALDLAKLQSGYTILRAPSAGRVAKKNVEVGQRLQTGQPVMAIVSDDVWVVANFKESQLSGLRAGQKVNVRIDAIDGRVFPATVESFSPGTGAKFALLPPDNSTGNFTKVVQRVPVKIVFAASALGADASRLSPGLSAVVKVAIRD